MIERNNAVFIDTNVISHLTKSGVSAENLNRLLSNRRLKAALGFFTLYEISVNLKTSDPKHAEHCYGFISELNPLFILPHWKLRELEIAQLRSNSEFNAFILDFTDQDGIGQAITYFSKGIFPKNVQIRIQEIEHDIKLQKDSWIPTVHQEAMRKRYKKNEFLKRRDDFFRSSLECTTHRQAIIDAIKQTTRDSCIITDSEALLLVKNIDEYPILRTTINNFLYFDFYTNQDKAPSIEKFKDSTQILDASYCSHFLSHEKGLLKNHLREVNPSIKPLLFYINKKVGEVEFDIIDILEEVS